MKLAVIKLAVTQTIDLSLRQSICLLICLFTTVGQAQESISPNTSTEQQAQQQASQAQSQTPSYPEYYTVNEEDTQTVEVPSKSDTSVSMAASLTPGRWLESAKVVVVNLLKWALHNTPLTSPQEKYARKLHFGRWINDPTDDTCMNTRARVLVRDSEGNVTYKGSKQCVVEAGQWHDPYANQEVTVAKEIQIDHMVPLKNAYISGAWEWDYKTRCLYANYMNFTPHLVSAGGHENMSKSDSGPEKYLPPNENYRCEYVRNWLAIKAIWKLKMNRDEVQAIHDAVVKYNCNINAFMMSQDGLAKQRAFIEENLNFCVINKR